MSTSKLTQTIDRPVADVFATVTDLTTYPEWNPTTASATKLTEGDLKNGTRFELSVRGLGKQEMELTEFEQNKRVRLEPRSKMFGGGHRFTFDDNGDKTTVHHELQMDAKGIFILMSPFMRIMASRNLKKTASSLKRHLESSDAAASGS